MREKISPEVIVVGAGPVGLTTALALHKRGISVEVVECDERPGTHSYALALHPESAEMLGKWGLLDSLENESLRIESLLYCNASGPQHCLNLSDVTGQKSGLLVVGQDHLETALIQPLEKDHVPIHWSSRLSSLDQSHDTVDIKIEKLMEGLSGYAMARLEWQVDKEIKRQSRYLIGADGNFSMVRRSLGIDFPKVALTQSFAVFEFKTDYAHDNQARIVYSDEGTSVMWPLPNGYCRWGFEIDPAAAEKYSREKDRMFVQIGNQGYRALESSMLRELLEKRAPWFDGSIDQFRWRVVVRFEKRLASPFGRDRVWLAGDAGHVTGPVGMQSMNVGMQEGRDLAHCIADSIGRMDSVQAFEDYNAKRLTEWKALLGMSHSFTPRENASDFLKSNADKVFSSIPASLGSLPAFANALSMQLDTA